MTKIQALLKTMQLKATQYLQHLEPYVSRDGHSSRVAVGSDQPVRDRLFVQDILVMLDGPEQRAAEAEADQRVEDLRLLVRSLMRDLHVVDHVLTLNPGTAEQRVIVASRMMEG